MDSKSQEEDTPATVDDTQDGEEIGDVANEVLNTEGGEKSGETPQVTDDLGEGKGTENVPESGEKSTPEAKKEEKSINAESKRLEDLEAKTQSLEQELKKSNDFNVKLVELIEAMNDELNSIKKILEETPVRK